MSIFSNTNIVAGASGKQRGYTIEESLRFNASQSSYLSWTPASAGNRKTFTYSCWTKRGLINTAAHTFGITAASSGNSARNEMEFDGTANEINIGFNPTGSAWFESFTNAVFRDPSAWYHIVVSVDMTQATDTNRLKVYVNGVSQTFRVYSIPTQNTDLPINNNTLTHSIGRYQAGGTSLLDGYLTEVNFIDGQALDASSFGEYNADTGVWQPAEYDGTYGTNGFYLPFGFDAPATSDAVEVLVIAGGGGGGSTAGGGGGAGGFREATLSISTSSTYTVTVGAGGPSDTPGNDSVFSTVTSVAGGNGSPFLGGGNGSGAAGGSGGGAGGRGQAGVTQSGGTGTAYQGNNGEIGRAHV